MGILNLIFGRKKTDLTPKEVDQTSYTLGAVTGETRIKSEKIEEKINSGFSGTYSRLEEVIVRLDRIEKNMELRDKSFLESFSEKMDKVVLFFENTFKRKEVSREKIIEFIKNRNQARISDIAREFNIKMPSVAYHLDELIKENKVEKVQEGEKIIEGLYRVKSESSLKQFTENKPIQDDSNDFPPSLPDLDISESEKKDS